MRKMTESFLQAAFAGESQAHMRYLAFAERARKEGFPNLARTFEAIAFAEQVHATNHLRVLNGIKGSADNVQEALDGETFEIVEMYPVYHSTAEFQAEKDAVRTTNAALEAEKVHAAMYTDAKKSIEGGKDVGGGTVYICESCGFTALGEAPERCPVCGAPKARFRAF
jgi:rubrerythrin